MAKHESSGSFWRGAAPAARDTSAALGSSTLADRSSGLQETTRRPRTLGVASTAEVEEVLGTPSQLILLKVASRLNGGTRELIARSTVVGLGFLSRDGAMVAAFVGADRGFAEAVDDSAVRVPLPRSYPSPAAGTGIGMVFLLAGVGDALRVNGHVSGFANGRLTVQIQEVYVHCSRAVRRAQLWNSPVRSFSAARPRDGEPRAPLDDPDVEQVMASSPFLVVSSTGLGNSADASPRGDAPGFVHRLDGRTLALPDRQGNKRADTFHNLAVDGRIALAALVPGSSRVAMISGTGTMSTDPALLSSMSVEEQAPRAALLMHVDTARVVDCPALAAADLWAGGSSTSREPVPDLNALASQQIALNASAGANRMLGLLLKPLNAVPGLMNRVTAFGLQRALVAEGYTSEDAAGGRRTVRISSLRRETGDAISVRLRDSGRRRFSYRPGQSYTVAVDIDGRIYRRAYSASDRPGRSLRLTIRREQGGAVSTWFHDRARVGDQLDLTGPSGDFTPLEAPPSSDLVLIGAGSGITPFFSVIATAIRKKRPGRIVLLIGNRTERDIIFRRALRRAVWRSRSRLTVRQLLTQPPSRWSGGAGRLSSTTIHEALQPLTIASTASYWVCGPSAMTVTVRQVLLELGVPAPQVHAEAFARPLTASNRLDRGAQPMTVRRGVENIGRTTLAPGTTILEAGLAADLPMLYSCTVGTCGTCAVRLTAGTVETPEPDALAATEVEDGFILACIARPTSPVEVDVAVPPLNEEETGTGAATWRTPTTLSAGPEPGGPSASEPSLRH